MKNAIKIGKKIGEVTVLKRAVTNWKREPTDFTKAAQSAVHYAKKWNMDTMIVPGNRYGHAMYHIMNIKGDPVSVTAMNVDMKIAIAKPNGDVFNAIWKKRKKKVSEMKLMEMIDEALSSQYKTVWTMGDDPNEKILFFHSTSPLLAPKIKRDGLKSFTGKEIINAFLQYIEYDGKSKNFNAYLERQQQRKYEHRGVSLAPDFYVAARHASYSGIGGEIISNLIYGMKAFQVKKHMNIQKLVKIEKYKDKGIVLYLYLLRKEIDSQFLEKIDKIKKFYHTKYPGKTISAKQVHLYEYTHKVPISAKRIIKTVKV